MSAAEKKPEELEEKIERFFVRKLRKRRAEKYLCNFLTLKSRNLNFIA